MKKHSGLFKEKLLPQDRINAPPIRLKLDPTKNVAPRAHSCPYDVPYNVREAMNNELSDAIEAGVVKAVNGFTRCFRFQNQENQK